MVEFFAVVFAADQLGDQVVGQRAAPASDHVLEVVVEGLKGVEDAGLVGGEISSRHCQLEQSEGDFPRFASAIHPLACDL